MIDLHMHSCYSIDGDFTPTELVEKSASTGIKILSITDHNSVRANEEARKAAVTAGVSYIPGIEIDCVFQGAVFHVLGYGIDYHSADFADLEKNVVDQAFCASLEMLFKTQALGFHLKENDMAEVSKDSYYQGVWTGEMFAEVLLNKPEYRDHPLLLNYRPGGSRSDNPFVNFYWDFYSQGKPCYVALEFPQMETAIDVIHQNHGIAVLAHPGNNLKGKESFLPAIAALGIDGIEAFSSYHTQEQSVYYYQQAIEMGKFITCGSDYHGKTKPAISIGGTDYPPMYDRSTMEETIKKTLKYIEEKNPPKAM